MSSSNHPDIGNVNIDSSLSIPRYDDMNDADERVSSVAISNGQEPHGIWWHNGTRWFSGDRTKFDIAQQSLGGNSNATMSVFEMPTAMEIDVWQAHIGIIDGTSSDVYLDIYNNTTDTVLFEHGHSDNGNAVVFGDPISVEAIDDGNVVHLRARNDSGGSVTFSGWLVWSFQEQL